MIQSIQSTMITTLPVATRTRIHQQGPVLLLLHRMKRHSLHPQRRTRGQPSPRPLSPSPLAGLLRGLVGFQHCGRLSRNLTTWEERRRDGPD